MLEHRFLNAVLKEESNSIKCEFLGVKVRKFTRIVSVIAVMLLSCTYVSPFSYKAFVVFYLNVFMC